MPKADTASIASTAMGTFDKTEAAEGEIQRVVYLIPAGRTSLEVLGNDEQMSVAGCDHPQPFHCAPGHGDD